MGTWLVETVVSEVVVLEVHVPDGFSGHHQHEAQWMASRGLGNVVEDHPAAGPITHLNYEDWEATCVDEDKNSD